MTIRAFSRCVQLEDTASLLKIPGVGKKMADQLIIDMRDRIDAVVPGRGDVVHLTTESSARNEAIDALISLGYKLKEVNKLIEELDIEDKSAEDIIRLALRQVAQ